MTGLFDRTVDVHRLRISGGGTDATVGDVGYIGAKQSASDPNGEVVIATKLMCTIQAGPAGRKKVSALPTDVVFAPTWKIFIPSTVVSQYTIRDRDILIDDEGYRYEVGQNFWTILGYQLVCIRLEA